MTRLDTLTHLLQEFGYDVRARSEHGPILVEADQVWTEAEVDPITAVRRVLAARREAETARGATTEIMASVEGLQGLLEELLGGAPLLCRLEEVRTGSSGIEAVVVRVGGQLRELAVHPDVDAEALRRLMPWHYVAVHPEELVVIGYRDGPELLARAQGDLVEFLGWADEPGGLVRVSGLAQDERIARLAPNLHGIELQPPARLVLQRDDERWAIAAMPRDRRESRYEISIDSITTRLDDLAGLDDVKARLVEDLYLRLVRPDLLDDFGIRPMRGLILESHKPGQGKTALIRAYAAFARELGTHAGAPFDVVLYFVPPNAFKSVWHGEDAKLVRDELCGAIRARQMLPRAVPLFQIVVLDELDSIGRRGGEPTSSAQNDALTALLSEMDGLVQWTSEPGQPAAELMWVGMTNRIDLVDLALRRPGRFDVVLRIPDATLDIAEDILVEYSDARAWYLDGEVRSGVDVGTLRAAFFRPALGCVYDEPVLRYSTESQSDVTVTAGRLMSNAHYEAAANRAKARAGSRALQRVGVPAVTVEDLIEALFEQAFAAARQMSADRVTLSRELEVAGRVTRVELLGVDESRIHRYLRVS